MLRNLMIGLPVMLLCLALQTAFSFGVSHSTCGNPARCRPPADCSRRSARC